MSLYYKRWCFLVSNLFWRALKHVKWTCFFLCNICFFVLLLMMIKLIKVFTHLWQEPLQGFHCSVLLFHSVCPHLHCGSSHAAPTDHEHSPAESSRPLHISPHPARSTLCPPHISPLEPPQHALCWTNSGIAATDQKDKWNNTYTVIYFRFPETKRSQIKLENI